jgi:anti-sigma-K factor RskA
MKCAELKDSFELYALGLLEPEEREEIDAHLARSCETCARGLTGALAVNSLFLSLSPAVVPPSRLKHRVMAGAGARRSSWGWLGAAAAAALLVVALWFSVQERRRTAELVEARQSILEGNAQRDRLVQAMSFLNEPDTRQVNFGAAQGVRGNVLVNPRLGVLFAASNLPALAAGQTYQMWVIPKSGEPRPAGLFEPGPDGAAMHVLRGPVDPAVLDSVAISVEPASGSPAPTTRPVVAVALAGG